MWNITNLTLLHTPPWVEPQSRQPFLKSWLITWACWYFYGCRSISWSFGWKRITSLIEFEADFTQSASYTEFIKSERCPDVRFHNTGCIMSSNISNTGILLAKNSEQENDVVMWPYSFIVQTRSESAKTKQAANSWLRSVSALMQDLPHPHCSASCNREISSHLLLWQLFTLFIF